MPCHSLRVGASVAQCPSRYSSMPAASDQRARTRTMQTRTTLGVQPKPSRSPDPFAASGAQPLVPDKRAARRAFENTLTTRLVGR
jgi:hypothetical protein